MPYFNNLKDKLKEQIPCTVGFKVFVYFSLAAIWLNLAMGN